MYQSYNDNNQNEISWEAQVKIRRIIDKNDGEVDYQKLERYIKKQGWDVPREVIKRIERLKMDRPPDQGSFRTGLNQYREDQKKQKGQRYDDDYGDRRY